jgi:tetratricopeptide (TPR) repeat protein
LAVGGVLLSRSLDRREMGQSITGNAQSRTSPSEVAGAVRERPQDPRARVDYARALLAEGKLVDALKEFDAAARLDPGNAEAKAYGGWIVFLAGLTDDALRRLDQAVAANPAYPEPTSFGAWCSCGAGTTVPGGWRSYASSFDSPPAGSERAQVEATIAKLEAAPTPPPAQPGP